MFYVYIIYNNSKWKDSNIKLNIIKSAELYLNKIKNIKLSKIEEENNIAIYYSKIILNKK